MPASTLHPLISVIIPAKDASSHLAKCLQAAKSQEGLRLGSDYEIILVDDGSSDNTAEVAAGMQIRVLPQPNAGPAAARNRGARAASGAILAFTDADCVPSPGWLAALTAPFRDPSVYGVKGVYRTVEKGLIPRFVQVEYEDRYQRMAQLDQIDFIDTYSAAYRREVFLQEGGFNEIFPRPSVEDQELSFRLAARGLRLVFAPAAAVYHRHDLSVGEYVARKFGIGYWKAVMLRWLPERALRDSHTPPVLRWQILLTGLGTAAVIGSFVWRPLAWAALAGLSLFLLSCLPFFLFALRRDPPLWPLVAPFMLLRSYALGLGLALGLLFGPRRRPG